MGTENSQKVRRKFSEIVPNFTIEPWRLKGERETEEKCGLLEGSKYVLTIHVMKDPVNMISQHLI